MTSDERTDSPALTALTELGRGAVRRPAKGELERGLDALHLRIAAGRTHQRRLYRWSVAAMLVAACFEVGWQLVSGSRTRPADPGPRALAYEIQGGVVLEHGYLRESDHTGIRLRFSEGSRVELMPGTRGRLRGVGQDGASVAIDNGSASFTVVPGTNRRWVVEIGPFLVTVKGTEFTVAWDPQSERFELRLRKGQVVVSGPISGGDLTLRAGQRLVVNLAKAQTVITEEPAWEAVGTPADALDASIPPEPGLVAPQGPRAPIKASGSSSPADSTMPAAPKSDAERRWVDQLASGQWDRILEDVERTGLEPILNKASSEDLFALADAARYRRRPDLARAALLAQRRRFPDSPRALDALFLLGRVEESRSGGAERSIAWYDEYLTRAPTGAYAAEALGRKMTLTNELNGPASARPIAEQYLHRFPKGSYAGSARALLRVH